MASSLSNPSLKSTLKLQQKKDKSFYFKSGISGATAAAFSHVIMVPVDVVKTRIQMNQSLQGGLLSTLKKLIQVEGIGSLAL